MKVLLPTTGIFIAYVGTLADLSNREITGYLPGPNKDASIIEKAFLVAVIL